MSELATQHEVRQSHEIYGRSLYGLRQLGKLSLDQFADAQETEASRLRAWNDFVTGTEENLATDPEFGEKLIFDSIREWNIVDDRVVSEDGTPMVELVKSGWRSSKQAAETDARMKIQATRDEGDVLVAGWVDNLLPGEMLTVVSMDPKDAIDSDKVFWEGSMAYRKGMAVIQTYYRESDKVLTGTYAVKRSNKQAMAAVLQGNGVQIQAETDDSLWTRYPIRKPMSRDAAVRFGSELREQHRKYQGDNTLEFSVTQYVDMNRETVTNYFNTYIPKLAEATHTGRNNETLQQLAQAILEQSSNIERDLVRSLIRVANAESFTDDDARTMEAMIRYALVEELRKNLPKFMSRESTQINHPSYSYSELFAVHAIGDFSQNVYMEQTIHMQVAKNIGSGVEAKRSYGGCAPGSVASENKHTEFSIIPGFQDVFGGTETKEQSNGDEDEYGSLEFECTKGHKNRRPRGKLIPKCTTCKEDVSCG